MIPKTKIHCKEDVLNVVNEIESKGYELEVSEIDAGVFLCGCIPYEGIQSEYLFNLTWEELTEFLDENEIEYFESRS